MNSIIPPGLIGKSPDYPQMKQKYMPKVTCQVLDMSSVHVEFKSNQRLLKSSLTFTESRRIVQIICDPLFHCPILLLQSLTDFLPLGLFISNQRVFCFESFECKQTFTLQCVTPHTAWTNVKHIRVADQVGFSLFLTLAGEEEKKPKIFNYYWYKAVFSSKATGIFASSIFLIALYSIDINIK